jgi:hypothetical protein
MGLFGFGKKKKKGPDFAAQYQQAVAQYGAPTAAETYLRDNSLATLNDNEYSDGLAGGLHVDLRNVAQARRQLEQSALPTGNAALAGPGNATAIGLARLKRADALAEADASDYQDQIEAAKNRARGGLLEAGQMEAVRKGNLLQSAQSLYQQELAKPKKTPFWKRLLGAAAGTAANFFAPGSGAIANDVITGGG